MILKLYTNVNKNQHLHDLNLMVTLVVLLLTVKPYFSKNQTFEDSV